MGQWVSSEDWFRYWKDLQTLRMSCRDFAAAGFFFLHVSYLLLSLLLFECWSHSLLQLASPLYAWETWLPEASAELPGGNVSLFLTGFMYQCFAGLDEELLGLPIICPSLSHLPPMVGCSINGPNSAPFPVSRSIFMRLFSSSHVL